MKNRGKGRERWRPSGAWNIFILFLSAYVILALIIGYSLPQDSQIARFLRFGDAVACAFFLADVFMRFMAAEDRVGFWKYGWIDLVSSIPNIAPLRWGRLYNFLRFIRALRAIRATMRISEYFFEDKLKNTFAFIASLTFACVAISGVLVLHFEKNAPGATIVDASDALWWTVNTITTVGSGGVYPVTEYGKIVGICLMFMGIGLFTSTSGIVAAWMLGDSFKTDAKKNCRAQKLSPQTRSTRKKTRH